MGDRARIRLLCQMLIMSDADNSMASHKILHCSYCFLKKFSSRNVKMSVVSLTGEGWVGLTSLPFPAVAFLVIAFPVCYMLPRAIRIECSFEEILLRPSR